MSFGNSPYQLKWAKGIKTKAAEFSKNFCLSGKDRFCDGFGVAIFFSAVSINKEGLLPNRKIFFRKLQQGFVKLGVVDTGGETDPVIFR